MKLSFFAKPGVRKKLGVLMIVLSVILGGLWGLAMVSDISSQDKGSITLAILVAGEIAFWIGVTLLGKELWDKYKAGLNPLNWWNRAGKTPEDRE